MKIQFQIFLKIIFFHFKKRFFDELNWGTKEFDDIIKVLKTKYNNIVFSPI